MNNTKIALLAVILFAFLILSGYYMFRLKSKKRLLTMTRIKSIFVIVGSKHPNALQHYRDIADLMEEYSIDSSEVGYPEMTDIFEVCARAQQAFLDKNERMLNEYAERIANSKFIAPSDVKNLRREQHAYAQEKSQDFSVYRNLLSSQEMLSARFKELCALNPSGTN